MTAKQTNTSAYYQLAEDPMRRIDSQRAVVHGVVAMQVGEAIGHGIYADPTTLQLARTLSNLDSSGVRGRFGHPGMSENATGKKLMRGKEFRIDGDKLRFDMHLLESARKSPAFKKDPVEYMLEVAKREPTELGMSYVLRTDLVWTLKDGTEREIDEQELMDFYFGGVEAPENAEPPMPVMRPTEVAFLDIVNEGALTSVGDGGMFEMNIAAEMFSGRSSAFLVELYDLMDRFRAQYKVPLDMLEKKADFILDSYLKSRKGKEEMARKKRVALEDAPQLDMGFDSAVVADGETEIDTSKMQELGEQVADEIERINDTSDGFTVDSVEFTVEGEDETNLDDLESEMSAVLSDISAEPEEAPATAAQFAHLQSQVAHLLGTAERQQGEIKRLTGLLQQSLQALQILHRNQERLAGEPVVTEVVDPTPALGMESFAFGHPAPHTALEAGHIAKPKRQVSKAMTEKQAAARSVEINARRQQMFGTPSSK